MAETSSPVLYACFGCMVIMCIYCRVASEDVFSLPIIMPGLSGSFGTGWFALLSRGDCGCCFDPSAIGVTCLDRPCTIKIKSGGVNRDCGRWKSE